MTTDMAVHKKQYELLSLAKKMRLMETKAEQHHEHMTKEERKMTAQIRSVAATLYGTLDLDGPEGRPNNLPQPAWRLAELFFWSDLS
jgi:hypothetical protein